MNTYLEEIINALDFQSLDNFLTEHMRVEMNVTELVQEISVNGLEAFNKENITPQFPLPLLHRKRNILYTFCRPPYKLLR